MAYASLEALRNFFGDHVISHCLWLPHSPNLRPFEKLYKTNLHSLEDLRNNICQEIQQFLRKNSVESPYSAGTLSASGQEGNIFTICYSTSELLLYFYEGYSHCDAYC
jgi:hypothetical protein